MKTDQVMEREFLGHVVRQRMKNAFICLNDLIPPGNLARTQHGLTPMTLQPWLAQTTTKELIAEVEARYGSATKAHRGRYGGTWAHPIIAMDLALTMHPSLKVDVYEWMLDELLDNRDKSGDSSKYMNGSLYEIYPNRAKFSKYIRKVNRLVRMEVGYDLDADNWNKATAEQLAHRDALCQSIGDMADVIHDHKQAVVAGMRACRKRYDGKLDK